MQKKKKTPHKKQTNKKQNRTISWTFGQGPNLLWQIPEKFFHNYLHVKELLHLQQKPDFQTFPPANISANYYLIIDLRFFKEKYSLRETCLQWLW